MALDLPSGARCFVDANILYYAFTEDPKLTAPCQEFLRRVGAGELTAHTTVQTLADAVHKTMMLEVVLRSGQQRPGLIGWLNKHPEVLAQLRMTTEVAQRLVGLNLQFLAVEPPILLDAVAISREHQLLTNDALIIALMRQHGLTDLVTNDDDFDDVDGLTVWKPR